MTKYIFSRETNSSMNKATQDQMDKKQKEGCINSGFLTFRVELLKISSHLQTAFTTETIYSQLKVSGRRRI
jgi:hypothetical protein